MPDRTLPLILAVLGALAVLAVALFVDVQRAARRGPRRAMDEARRAIPRGRRDP